MALRNGSRLGVSMADVFPNGCHLVPDSITEAQDYDEATGRRSPAVDKYTGKPVFQCRVSDMDPELEGRQRETVVKILADRMPAPPTGRRSSWWSSTACKSPPTWTPAAARARDAAVRGWRSRCAPPGSRPPVPSRSRTLPDAQRSGRRRCGCRWMPGPGPSFAATGGGRRC